MATLPTRMLVDSVLLNIPSGVNAWQGNSGGNTIRLYKVHVQRKSGLNNTAINNELQTNAVIWYDCKLSKPRNLDFFALKASAESVGSSISVEFGGVKYGVKRIIEHKDGFGRLHHYEIEVE